MRLLLPNQLLVLLLHLHLQKFNLLFLQRVLFLPFLRLLKLHLFPLLLSLLYLRLVALQLPFYRSLPYLYCFQVLCTPLL